MAGEVFSGSLVASTLTRISLLQRDRQYRDKYKRFFVEGVHNFVAAFDHGWPVETLLYSERLLTSAVARKLVRQSKRAGVPFVAVTPEQFRSISQAERASGVGAILRQQLAQLSHTSPGTYPCWVVLDRIRAPGNFGTLLRTSAAIGAAGFILLGDTIDPYHPAVIRASMGAFFGQKLVRASPDQLGQWVKQHDLLVVGASPEGKLAYNELAYTRPTVLMLGEERTGLSEVQRSLCREFVRIPMAAGSDSLNLGVAGSLLMYEILRE